MKVDSARFVPVIFDFPDAEARQTCWGRFLELAADQARLMARARLARGDKLSLRFSLPGEEALELAAAVASAEKDEDGYYVARLRFLDTEAKLRLGRALSRLLSRS